MLEKQSGARNGLCVHAMYQTPVVLSKNKRKEGSYFPADGWQHSNDGMKKMHVDYFSVAFSVRSNEHKGIELFIKLLMN